MMFCVNDEKLVMVLIVDDDIVVIENEKVDAHEMLIENHDQWHEVEVEIAVKIDVHEIKKQV